MVLIIGILCAHSVHTICIFSTAVLAFFAGIADIRAIFTVFATFGTDHGAIGAASAASAHVVARTAVVTFIAPQT